MKWSWHKFFISSNKTHAVREIASFMVFSLAIFFLLSLLSFHPQDNSVSIKDGYDFHNWLGPVGAYIADNFFSFFGIFSILFPFGLFFISFKIFIEQKILSSFSTGFGLFLIYLGFAPMLAQLISPESLSFPLAGFWGAVLKTIYTRYLGNLGLYLLSINLIIFGTLLTLGKNGYLNILEFFKKIRKKNIVKKDIKEVVKIKEPIIETEEKIIAINPVDTGEQLNIIARDKKDLTKEINKAEKISINKDISFTLPPLKLLDYDEPSLTPLDQNKIKAEADKLHRAFLQFGIEGQIREIRPGPVVTLYEYVPAPGIKLSKIAALSDDIAMAMSAVQVRIVTPIPGKGAVGIEVPNDKRETVYLKEIVADENYRKQKHPLCMAVGKDVEGQSYFMNLSDMPHVLIAGTTGSGKSVSVNAMICSILYRATPKEVRFLMIDPKMLELSIYNGIPHLLLPPIIDSKKAANALRWAVKEMDDRYNQMKEFQVRDINTYNDKIKDIGEDEKHKLLPYIVIVVDEYADLLAVAGKEVEGYIMRLAQKARASGIHVMLATQRPSVDVITGVIKANFPVRMSFRLASSHDSKTIINKTGAEKLLGRGDVLIMPPGTSDVLRVHGAFISEKELNRVVEFLRSQKNPGYDESIANFEEDAETSFSDSSFSKKERDEKFEEALKVLREYQKCSTSFMQRQLSIGYNRAAKLVEQMEKEGIVGPALNAKGDREIFFK